MASCTRPSTANDDASSGSSLSTPPASPSQLPTSSTTAEKKAEDVEKDLPKGEVPQLDPEATDEPAVDGQAAKDEGAIKDPQPYVNRLVDFDYYDQSEPQDGSDADQNPVEPRDKFPFPKVTEVGVFEEYLKDAEEMSYEELYRRTAIVSDNLVVYQAEWDKIDKEIFQHESYLRSEEKRIEEETRAALEEDRLREDEERDRTEEEWAPLLKLPAKKWLEFITEFESSNPGSSTLRHLQNLRNPQFMAAARKKKRIAENKLKNLADAPWPEVKKTKEDLEIERRKRGRYMDPVKFDDMKQADIYGFEYSAHIKHYGQQPMATTVRQTYPNSNPTSNPFGDDSNDASRTRTQRKQTRKVYEAEASVTPEDSETDGKLPLKRARKPKIFIDGVETLDRSRGQSRSGTPVIRTFASGKRVGRPPAKSKLQAVQLAQPSETPDVASGSDAPKTGPEGPVQDNDAESRELAPSQEAQLHDAAELLVNQTQTDQAAASAAPIVKRKHPGGRPRKIRTEITAPVAPMEIPVPEALQPGPRNRGGRQRKTSAPVELEDRTFEAVDPEPLKRNPKKRGGRRVKKEAIPDEELQLGEENGVLQSTEQDDGSQYTSADTRPTTSDSNATASTFASRRSARPATREKTNAREARASTINRRNSVQDLTVSASTSTRSKRKRNSSDTDPSPIVVQPAFTSAAEPSTKKRRARAKQDSDDVIEAISETTLGVPTGRSKRKRRDTISESIAVAAPFALIDLAPAPKKRRRGTKVAEPAEPEIEEEDSDAGIDEELLDPVAREALRKKRVKKEKSRKLSRNMKARWANGGMKEAQETRRTNNALKRSWKQQALANEAAGLPPPPPPVLVGTAPNSAPVSVPTQVTSEQEPETPVEVETPATTTPTPAPKPSKKKNKARAPPPKRPSSTRVKRPTRAAMGLDGVDDEDDEIEQQFASEYDRFQALTSPKGGIKLGKRVRKSLVDLSQLMDDSDEDDF